MAKPAKRDLIRRALDAVDREEEIAFDVAAAEGLMFANVRHMPEFIADVANEMIDSVNKWAHLEYVTPNEVRGLFSRKSR